MVILAAEINGLFLKAGEWRCGFSEGGYYRDLWPARRVEPKGIFSWRWTVKAIVGGDSYCGGVGLLCNSKGGTGLVLPRPIGR
ncbi:hypothetical protein A9Q89_02320 [Gammaproteobacteria bacterium 53_120_T64]|nr:hypothetical protein A9Q89_02320 [Gammaproteobacteria bacterium 53_120_T64]